MLRALKPDFIFKINCRVVTNGLQFLASENTPPWDVCGEQHDTQDYAGK